MKNNCKLELKISDELLRKFLYVAEKEKRTPAAQFAFMVRNNVAYYEKTKGRISDAELKKIDVPVLVLVGSRDVIAPEHTKLIVSSFPNATLSVVEGGHNIVKTNSLPYIEAVEKFYEGVYAEK